MYVVCNHAPGPSVLGAPDPRRTDPAKDSHQETATDHTLTPSRTCISRPPTITRAQRPWSAPNRMWLTSSEVPAPTKHHLQQNEQEQHSHTRRNRDTCPVKWARTIRSLAPVRGQTRPSIPRPFHWLEGKCPETSSQESWIFFQTNPCEYEGHTGPFLNPLNVIYPRSALYSSKSDRVGNFSESGCKSWVKPT